MVNIWNPVQKNNKFESIEKYHLVTIADIEVVLMDMWCDYLIQSFIAADLVK